MCEVVDCRTQKSHTLVCPHPTLPEMHAFTTFHQPYPPRATPRSIHISSNYSMFMFGILATRITNVITKLQVKIDFPLSVTTTYSQWYSVYTSYSNDACLSNSC